MKKIISQFLVFCLMLILFVPSALAKNTFLLENMIIRADGDIVSLFWKNQEEISTLLIIDLNLGENISVEDVDCAKGAVNQLLLNSDGVADHKYEISCNGQRIIFQGSNEDFKFDSDNWRTASKGKKYVAQMTNDAYEGKYAFHLMRYGNDQTLIYGSNESNFEKGGEYQLSFYYKGTGIENISVRLGATTQSFEALDTDTWTRIEGLYTVNTQTPAIYFQPGGENTELWIDNVEIFSVNESGESLIKNGDFENTIGASSLDDFTGVGVDGGIHLKWSGTGDINGYFIYKNKELIAKMDKTTGEYSILDLENDLDYEIGIEIIGKNGTISQILEKTFTAGLGNDPVADKSQYQIRNLILRAGGGKTTFYWKNPIKEPSSIYIYRQTETGDEFIPCDCSLVPSAINIIEIEGDTEDYYKLVCEFSDKTVAVKFSKPTSPSYASSNNWRGDYATAKCGFELSDYMPYNGNYCFHMFKYSWENVVVFYGGDTSQFEVGKTYRIGAWCRGVSNGGTISTRLGTGEKLLWNSSDEWRYIYTDQTVNAENPGISFWLDSTNDDLYIDDIEIKKLENGEAIGENLIENGDFETVTQISAIKNYSYVAGDGSVTLTWDAPSDDACDGVKVYLDNQLQGSFFLPKSAVVLQGLENDMKHKIKMVGMNANGDPIGKPIEFIIKPVSDAYTLGEVILKKDNKRTGNLSEGSFSVERKVTNNSLDAFSAQLLVGVYADNELIYFSGDKAELAKENNEKTLTVPFTIESLEKEVQVKVFLLDDINNRQALSEKVLYTE